MSVKTQQRLASEIEERRAVRLEKTSSQKKKKLAFLRNHITGESYQIGTSESSLALLCKCAP